MKPTLKLNIMTTENTYNGWTNYATWRVMLEFFDGTTSEESGIYNPIECKEVVEAQLEERNENETTLSYALAFIADVNWFEIYDAIAE